MSAYKEDHSVGIAACFFYFRDWEPTFGNPKFFLSEKKKLEIVPLFSQLFKQCFMFFTVVSGLEFSNFRMDSLLILVVATFRQVVSQKPNAPSCKASPFCEVGK